MKTLFTVLALLLYLAFTPVIAAPAVPDYPVEKIAAYTYVIHGPLAFPTKENQGFMNNPGFVITDQGVVVIDPGGTLETGRMVLRQIRRFTKKPVTHILNTHVHGDHWLGNQAFAEAFPRAVFYAHPEMIKKAKASEAENWINLMETLTEGMSKGTQAVIPDHVVNEGQSIKTGGFEFRIYAPEKAHSHTDIMIEVVNDSVLFLGDNVMAKRFGRMDDGTFRGNIKACDRALESKVKHFVPGHGKTGTSQTVNDYKDYLDIVYSEVSRFYEQGLADFEMKSLILNKVKKYQSWSGFEEEFGRHLSVAVLEVEKAEFE